MGINEYIKIGNRIKQLRKDKGYSQKEMSELAGIPYSTYSNYENNNREPNKKQLDKIANALDISLDDLLGHTGKIPILSSDIEFKYCRIFQLLKDKDEESERQLDLDKNHDPSTEQGRLDYACRADYIQFQLRRVLSDLYEFRKIIKKESSKNQLSLHLEILFALTQLNSEGERKILEEIENLSFNPKYRTPLKPDDWDAFDDI